VTQARELKLRKELLEAAYDDEASAVERLLAEAGADVNTQDPHGNSLLSEAAAGGAVRVLRLLLAHGADPTTQVRGGAQRAEG
jgi:ankyrin repeat protein